MDRPIRVGFIELGSDGWLGGRNYLRNLLAAITSQPDLQIEPVLLTRNGSNRHFDLAGVQTGRCSVLYGPRAVGMIRKVIRLFAGNDRIAENALRSCDIDVLSHSGHLGPRGQIPTIGWIADFQGMHLPSMEPERMKLKRERGHREYCEYCTKVIVASECGRADMALFSPRNAAKAEVLRFVAEPLPLEFATDIGTLRKKYEFHEPFFVLPNQFWAHKNHRTVVEALRVLKSRGRRTLVLCTGNTTDKRNPEHFASLMRDVERYDVVDMFRVLGVVPFADLAGMIYESVAVVNPSLFEGWSTSVEEAKSAGKSIILSDIPVHREQSPERGIYFSPQDPEALASALQQCLAAFDLEFDRVSQRKALAAFPLRQRQYALRYEEIVLGALHCREISSQ